MSPPTCGLVGEGVSHGMRKPSTQDGPFPHLLHYVGAEEVGAAGGEGGEKDVADEGDQRHEGGEAGEGLPGELVLDGGPLVSVMRERGKGGGSLTSADAYEQCRRQDGSAACVHTHTHQPYVEARAIRRTETSAAKARASSDAAVGGGGGVGVVVGTPLPFPPPLGAGCSTSPNFGREVHAWLSCCWRWVPALGRTMDGVGGRTNAEAGGAAARRSKGSRIIGGGGAGCLCLPVRACQGGQVVR